MNDRTDELVAAHRADIHSPPPATVQRWHDALDAAAAGEQVAALPEKGALHPTSFFVGMAVAATLALGIAIGFFIGDDDPIVDTPVVSIETPTGAVPVALSRGLQAYFRDSRQQIMSLPDAEDRTMLVLRIIEQNRMFENAAVSSDALKLARVLRAFEPILLRLAADDLAPADAEALQAQLAFELSVMLTKLGAGSSDDSQTT
jgi:hypothetical protein